MTLEWEAEVGEQAGRVITLVEGECGEELQAYIASLSPEEVAFVLVAVAAALLRQESINEVIAAANSNLFKDRNAQVAKVAELKEIQADQARMLERERGKRK